MSEIEEWYTAQVKELFDESPEFWRALGVRYKEHFEKEVQSFLDGDYSSGFSPVAILVKTDGAVVISATDFESINKEWPIGDLVSGLGIFDETNTHPEDLAEARKEANAVLTVLQEAADRIKTKLSQV